MHLPRFGIAPMQDHLVLRSKYETRNLIPARWGLVNSWAKDNQSAARCINAKAETVETRPSFKDAFLKRRCIVPADGFYEWRGPRNNREPLWIHPADGGLLLFAGLYESWHPEPDQWQRTFTIITTVANRAIEPIHDRMPAILDERAAEDWLNPNENNPLRLKALLRPAPDDRLVLSRASPLVNSVKNDGPELLAQDRTLPVQRSLL
jgi:putative SOS response-associated peptidase YedK